MKITIELATGFKNDKVTKSDIQKNINTLLSVREAPQNQQYFIGLTDTLSILNGIQEQLPW
jgi:hypothetical protein